MKKFGLITMILGFGLAVWAFSPNHTEEEKMLLTILTKILEINHYHDQKIDDDFSKKVYHSYIDLLDFNKMYFLKPDIEGLNKYETTLDDEINGQKVEFYYAVQQIMQERVNEVKAYCDEILDKPFDYSVDEWYEMDPEKRDYCKSKEDQKEYWRKYLKYTALNTYLSKLETQQAAIDKDENFPADSIKSEAEIEVDVRQQLKKNMNERFKRRDEIDDEDNFSFYVNSVSTSFGPHTQYFPPQQKENFDLRMTGTLEGIGALLQQEDGYTKISSIVTGSASWKQGQLKAGDIVLKVAQADGEPVDIVDAPMKEVLKLIRGKKGTEVRLTVQKPGGEIIIIPIVRDVVIREETYAKSATFKNTADKTIYGYINLPSFYSKFGKDEGRSSADDVQDELERLKAQHVNGIILDLRDNGGGSLQDAVKMAGLFIDKGPIVQVKDKVHLSQAKYDYNSTVTYDGPLVIMVNGYSASASEILAGAMLDYDRAIIIGSNSTYGKGTVQTFIDLNRYVDPQLVVDQPFGSLKYTVQQFYRINGSSTQFKGVASHIILPDLYPVDEIGEAQLDNALPWDSIPPVQYNKWNHANYIVSELQEKSMKRLNNNEFFAAVNERSDWLDEEKDKTSVSLNKEVAIKERKERKEKNDAFNALKFADSNIKVTSLQEFHNEADSIVEKKRTEWQDALAKDAYIREAMHVLNDMMPMLDVNKVVEKEKR